MKISMNTTQVKGMTPEAKTRVEEKLSPIARLLGEQGETALLELELADAPAEGRSATPTRLTATLSYGNVVAHAEAVKPNPESAADRVRRTLEAEVRRVRGKNNGLFKRGGARLKELLRFGA
jgi:ribosome-associated translation inhibitor RaiA